MDDVWSCALLLQRTTQAQNVLLKKCDGLWVACLADFGIGRIESLSTAPTVQVRHVYRHVCNRLYRSVHMHVYTCAADMRAATCVQTCASTHALACVCVHIGHTVQHVARAIQGWLHYIQVRTHAHTRLYTGLPARTTTRAAARPHTRMHAPGPTVSRSVT